MNGTSVGKNVEQISRLKAALKALEEQRSILGNSAVDLSQRALKEQIKDLEKTSAPVSQSKGERRHATIMFSDLSGYTAMNEKLDPEDVQELMNRIKTEAIRIVEHHGGSVNQFVGDEVLALFGIPNAHEDDPVRAVNAALDLHQVVNEMSKEVEPLIGRPLTMHSGINTGLIVTNVFDDRDGKIGLTGDTVNTGARLLSNAGEDEILVSPKTRQLIAPFFETSGLDPVDMKGKAEPMIPYRVGGRTEVQTRIEASEKRGFTELNGRDGELTTLLRCLDKAVKGKGQIVTVSGAAGLGKSRLIHEFLKDLDREKVTVLEGRCQAHGKSIPYHPFLDAIRRNLQLGEEDSPEILHHKVVTALLSMDTDLEQHLPAILQLLSIPSEQYSLSYELTGENLKRAIQQALILLNTVNKKGLTKVWVLEDWHWVDEASDATLIKHLEIMDSLQLMIIVLHRPEYKPDWEKLPLNTRIDLNALSEESARKMIQSIYGVDEVPHEFSAQIYRHSGGNPFFIEELCDLFKNDGTVIVGDGIIEMQKPMENITFPESVQAVIRTKLDRLYDESKEVLGLASVIGREFLIPILEQISSGIDELSSSIKNLKDKDLIRKIEEVSETTYEFNHVITQEVTYQILLKKRRVVLHDLVGESIELLYPERLEEQYEMLAHHYGKSQNREKALCYLELAGDKASKSFSLVEARSYYRSAMELIDSNKAHRDVQLDVWKRKFVDISLKWAVISQFSGPEEFIKILKVSLAYAEELNIEPKIAHLHYWFGQTSVITGNLEKAVENFTHAIEIAERCNEQELLAQCYSAIGRVYVFDVQYVKANEYLKKAMHLNTEMDEEVERAEAASVLGQSFCCTGDFKEALKYGEYAVKTMEEANSLSRKGVAYMWLGCSYCLQGKWKEALEVSVMTIEIARPLGDIVPLIVGTAFGGYALCMQGKFDKGLAKLEKSAYLIESNQFYLLFPIIYGSLAYGYIKAKKVDDALKAASKCLEWSEKGWKGWDPLANYTIGMAEAIINPNEESKADEAFATGISLCEERGQLPNLAQGYYEYANVLLQRSDKEQSRKYLGQARKLFEEMNMKWWVEEAKELEKQLG